MRSIIYIDGFNLYYGALKGGPHKWLNLERYFRLLRPHDNIQIVRYFSALIGGPKLANQKTYLKALETLPLVEITLGRFKTKQVRCRVPLCTHTGSRLFLTPEEKRTDVNIAVSLLDDAYQNLADRLIIVSGDSDLVPALTRLKAHFPQKELIVYVPSRNPVRGAAVELRTAADKDKMLPLQILPKAQFPRSIPDGAGGVLTKPTTW